MNGQPSEPERGYSMRNTMMIAALSFAAACVSPEEHRRLQGEKAALKAQIAQLSDDHQQLAVQVAGLRSENKELGARAADASWIADQKRKLQDLMSRYAPGGADQVSGVEAVQTAEGVAFRVAGGVLFDPGQAVLSNGGKRTLNELMDSLKGRTIRVEGHTDATPIRRSRWGTNLRLSLERAMSVADYLVSAGLPKAQVSAAGYGPNRPAADGSTAVALKKNRRVEILMIER